MLAQKDIPDLQFDAAERKQKGDSPERTEVMEIMDVDTKGSVTAPQNSDFREHSRNSLESAVGEAQERVSEQRSVKKTMNPELHSKTSEYREHFQESWSSEHVQETPRKFVKQTSSRDTHLQHSDFPQHSQDSRIKQVGTVEVTVSAEDTKHSAASSNFPEDSQNLPPSGEREVENGEANMSFFDRDGQCLATVSEFRELSPNSRVETGCSQGTTHKQHTKPVCISEPSEYLRDLLRGVGNNVSVPSFS